MALAGLHTFYGQMELEVVETKGNKRYYVTGYASTPEIDLLGDVVTTECMEDMLAQIKSQVIVCDFEHEMLPPSPSTQRINLIPVGKIVDAEMRPQGLWVKAEINQHSSRFQELWGSIKDGFIKGFSITYKPLETIPKVVQGAKRVLNKVLLYTITLTGLPVNRGAQFDGVMVKSLQMALEEISVTEENQNETPETPAENPTPEAQPAAPAVAPAAPDFAGIQASLADISQRLNAVEGKSVQFQPVETQVSGLAAEHKSLQAIVSTLQAEGKSLRSAVEKLEAENKSLKEALETPLFKGVARKSQPTDNESSQQKVDILAFC